MYYLGLDYGRVSIGIALATGELAEPFGTVHTARSISLIGRIIEEQKINALVIGLPDGPLYKETRSFGDYLSIHYEKPIYFVDESLSSHDASVALLHTSRSKRKRLSHAAAAAIILQSWLDTKDKE